MSDNKLIYDLVVIGSGPGGYVAAIRGAQFGMKTAVIERDKLGGVCLNWGCIPSKALLESARLLDEMKHADTFGLICENPQPDWTKVIQRSRNIADQMSGGVQYLMKKNKIDVINGTGTLKSKNQIDVKGKDGDKVIEARNVIIASGARPRSLPGLEYDGKKIIDSSDAMTLPKPPKRLLVVGAGAIGCEFAYFYSAMGTEVTIVELMDEILPIEDVEISKVVNRSFRKRKITIQTSSKVVDVKHKKSGSVYAVETPKGIVQIDADVCLVAVGVQPNNDKLGLEVVGVETHRGFIKVNDRMQSNIEGIYAIGDCAGPPLLAHVASHEGICAVETIAGEGHPMSYSNIPACTYCHPQVGSVGLTEAKAKEAGHSVKVGKYQFRANGRAVAGCEIDGMVKFVIDAEYNEVLGVHIVGPSAPELIAEIVIGRELEVTASEFAKTIHAHPTLSEAVMEAAADALGDAIHV